MKKRKKSRFLRPLRKGEPAFSLTHIPFYPTPLTPEDLEKMAKTEMQMLILNPNETVTRHLDTLLATGLWGRTRNEVAERLLEDRLRQEVAAAARTRVRVLKGSP